MVEAHGPVLSEEYARHALGSALLSAMTILRNKELNDAIGKVGTKKISEYMLGYFKNKGLVISKEK